MFPTPAPDFSDPLGLLTACHRRMREHCDLLERLHAHTLEHGSDAQAMGAADRVLNYFSTAARHHHNDEEQDLFPRLREDAGLANVIDDLIAGHIELEATWDTLREAIEAIALGHAISDWHMGMQAFVGAYRKHIEIEDTHILPIARTMLEDQDLAALAEAMAERRGVVIAT